MTKIATAGPEDLQLYYVAESPFASKLLFAIKELGLTDAVSLHAVSDPPPAELVEANSLYPLSAFVPSLVTPDGTLFDSSVILQYLDSLSPDLDGKLFPPADTRDRWLALTHEALSKGVMGTVMMVHQQRARGAGDRVLAPQEERARRGLERLAEYEVPDTGRTVLDVRGIALGSMLDYMSKCEWSSGWREWEGGSTLGPWFDEIKHRLP
ncbi:hypothetical protein CALVIDRAFT_561830 [Calocera viscosa TUFC12733]|uniref:GST N-terminal domain-containing protein n=1 Tax=Calocera viscosa (strain TUFC12733) TaxID=1330018 RepID=A0A167PKQ1_CALVF|nr:hypothetical protein CALVIDRAFT_561830 [Calocera viscosa TUFC12733]